MGSPSTQSKPTIKHMSHPHPLHLSNHNPTLTLAPSSCSGCKLPLSQGLTYTCNLCNYHLHIKCSEMPQQIKHPFDQSHVFSLFATPVYPDGIFRCDACGEHGSGFSYHCGDCGTDLHILCASMPLSTTHHSHHHNLNLVFSPPYFNKSFSCDVCKRIGGSHWLYRCGSCDFDAHLSCGTNKAIPAQSPPTAQIHQYQQSTGVPVHVVQPPPQMPAHLQQFVAAYGAAAGILPPGSPPVQNSQPISFMNHVNTGGMGPNSPITNGAFRMNQGAHNFHPAAPQVASQQTFHGQMLGRTSDNDAVLQLLLRLLRDNNGSGGSSGGNVNAQLLQAILSANGSSGSSGGGNDQLLQGMMGGGGGGGFDVSSLLGGNFDLSSLLGGNFNVSSLLGLMGGFGFS